jgi:hypothetical protein
MFAHPPRIAKAHRSLRRGIVIITIKQPAVLEHRTHHPEIVVVTLGPGAKRSTPISPDPAKHQPGHLPLGHPAIEPDRIDPEPRVDLRQLRDLAKPEWGIPLLHHVPEVAGHAMPDEQVAHDRFAENAATVRRGVPRPDPQPPRRDQPAQLRLPLGPHRQVILQRYGLRIEQKLVFRRVGHDAQQAVDETHGQRPGELKPLGPLAVEMRIADHVQLEVAGDEVSRDVAIGFFHKKLCWGSRAVFVR